MSGPALSIPTSSREGTDGKVYWDQHCAVGPHTVSADRKISQLCFSEMVITENQSFKTMLTRLDKNGSRSAEVSRMTECSRDMAAVPSTLLETIGSHAILTSSDCS